MRGQPAAVVGFALLVLASCGGGSSSAPPAPPSATAGASASSCGLSLYPPQHDPRCQAIVDYHCCSQEKACAADLQCASVFQCMMGCRGQADATCFDRCTGTTPEAQAQFIRSPAAKSYSTAMGCISHLPSGPTPAGVDCRL